MLKQYSEPDRGKGHKARLERTGTQFRRISKRVAGTWQQRDLECFFCKWVILKKPCQYQWLSNASLLPLNVIPKQFLPTRVQAAFAIFWPQCVLNQVRCHRLRPSHHDYDQKHSQQVLDQRSLGRDWSVLCQHLQFLVSAVWSQRKNVFYQESVQCRLRVYQLPWNQLFERLLPHFPQLQVDQVQKRKSNFLLIQICNLTYARLQGLSSLIEHFENSKVLNAKEKRYRPIIKSTVKIETLIKNQKLKWTQNAIISIQSSLFFHESFIHQVKLIPWKHCSV